MDKNTPKEKLVLMSIGSHLGDKIADGTKLLSEIRFYKAVPDELIPDCLLKIEDIIERASRITGKTRQEMFDEAEAYRISLENISGEDSSG